MKIDKTKDKILKVSRELFMRKGYDATSMSEIASSVGINKSSLYYFFKNKEFLYFEIMRKALSEITDYLIKVEKEEKIAKEKIIENLIIKSSKNSIIAYVMDTDSIEKKSKQLIEIHKGIYEIQEKFIKLCVKLKVENPQVVSEVILNAIHVYAIKSSCHKNNINPKDYSICLSELLKVKK